MKCINNAFELAQAKKVIEEIKESAIDNTKLFLFIEKPITGVNLRLSANGGYLTKGYSPVQISPVRSFAFGAAPMLFPPANSWGVGAALLKLGYRHAATTQVARANYDNAVALYRQTVLSAFQEVEDDLVALRILKEEAMNREQKKCSVGAKLIMDGYKSGMNSCTKGLSLLKMFYIRLQKTTLINGLRTAAAVGLIKALSSGWNGFQCCQSKKKITSKTNR
ncbi:TPA: hypothetical protein ACP9DH_002906 [Legionella anisa]